MSLKSYPITYYGNYKKQLVLFCKIKLLASVVEQIIPLKNAVESQVLPLRWSHSQTHKELLRNTSA